MQKLLKTMGYLSPTGRIDWREIRFDLLVIIFLSIMFLAISL